MNDLNPTKTLPAARFAIGLGSYAAPEMLGKLFGMKLAGNHEAIFLGRLFAVRDIALGAGVLASNGQGRKLWWQLGILCDAGDAAAGIMAFRAGGPKRGSIMATITALSAVGLGAAALVSGQVE